MKKENQLDKLLSEIRQDMKKHPIKWMWKDFKWWLITSINWVRIKLKQKQKWK
jgi:hypothetical protein